MRRSGLYQFLPLLVVLPAAVAFFGAFAPDWSNTLTVLAVAVALTALRPTGRPPVFLEWSLAGIAIFLVLALSPIVWWGEPAWRVALERDHELALGPLVSPQPLRTLLLLPLALSVPLFVWMIYAHDNDDRVLTRRAVWLGGVFLAGLAWLAVWRLAGGGMIAGEGFPFATRNQLATWLACGGVLCAGLALRALVMRVTSAWGWGLAAAAFAGAVLFNGARGGPLVFGLGLALFFMLLAVRARRVAWLAPAALLLLAGGLVLFTLEGEAGRRIAATFTGEVEDSFRWKVQRDTFAMILDAPVTGVGAGNYEVVFTFYRVESAARFRPAHPESDWLRLAAEAGIPALLAAVAALLLMLRLALRAAEEDLERMILSCAGIAVVVIPCLHAFFDAPTQSPANLFAALAALSLTVPARPLPSARPWRRGFALAGGTTLVVAALVVSPWFFSARKPPPVDNTTPLHAQFELQPLQAWLRMRPLDWETWYLAGHALLRQGDQEGALAAFRLTRFLEPFQTVIPEREAALWLDVGRLDLAAEAMAAHINRVAPEKRPELARRHEERLRRQRERSLIGPGEK